MEYVEDLTRAKQRLRKRVLEKKLDEENFFDNFVEQAKYYGQLNMVGSSRVTTEHANKHAYKVQRQTTTKDVSVQIKRIKRQSAVSPMMAKGIVKW
ncbi:Urease subunit alpha [Bienertia sinuspersici]